MENIGNLPLGNVDVIITSPPYADSKKAGEVKPEEVEKYARQWEENVEKRGWNSWGKSFHTPGRLRGIKSLRDGYSKNKENIGNLPVGNIDAVITSPPYSDAISRQGGPTGVKNVGISTITAREYSPNLENIGNLKSSDEEYEALAKGLMTKDGKPTYLSEMLKVYRECYKVLKPNGLAIIVVKPFVRNKKPIDLPYHTYILLSKCGFILEKLYKLRLKQQSFWRILYRKKYPDVPEIRHEYVLVMRKT